jgi:hypothetical protein
MSEEEKAPATLGDESNDANDLNGSFPALHTPKPLNHFQDEDDDLAGVQPPLLFPWVFSSVLLSFPS